MSSHIDRIFEKGRRKKAIRDCLESWKKEYRRMQGVAPTDRQCRDAKAQIAAAFDKRATVVMGPDGAPVVETPAALQRASQAPRGLQRIGHFTEKGIELNGAVSPEIAADLALMADLVFHSHRFRKAATHAEQLEHLQGAITGLLKAAQIRFPHLEAPPIIAALADIDDMRAGRDGRLLQALADPVLPPMPSRMEPSQRMIASAYVVALGLAVEKITEGTNEPLTKVPALRKVIAALEKAMHIDLNTIWTDGKTDLCERFADEHRGKLIRGDVGHAAKLVFDGLKRSIDAKTPEQLKAEYPVMLIQAQAYILQAKERPDTKRKKGGSRRVQAQEKNLPFSTADE
ncbi:MAG: hypothetical protein K2Z80_12310 [Xanthobacteraceae bacterium]|nr:hypothetical protein [Xanthobacteraceae bacterium]